MERPFSHSWDGWTNITFPSLSIDPKMSTCETTPAIFFSEKNIAGVVSQFLILGSIDKEGKVILVHPSRESENGLPVA